MLSRLAALLAICACLALQTGCVYRMGRNLTDGILDEAVGDQRPGVQALGDDILERNLATELGVQLGSGLTSGATDITPEQQQRLEDLIDGLLTVASQSGGDGIRHDVSPAVRDLVKHDIIEALRDGLRDDVGPQLNEIADGVITRSIVALRRGLQDPETHLALADILSDSFYIAMREGGRAPGVEDTLQGSLETSVLGPFEESVGGITDNVATKFEEQARRTERTLQGIIAVLAVVLGVFLIMYLFSQRQLTRERKANQAAEQGLQAFGAAIGQLAEPERKKVLERFDELRPVGLDLGGVAKDSSSQDPQRSDDYTRKGKK